MASQRKRTRSENALCSKSEQYYKKIDDKIIDGKPKAFYECTICKSQINGQNPSNLSSHLQYKHKEIFNTLNAGKKESIFFKRLKLLICLVEMVSINGRVFQSILDTGFLSIIQNKLDKFNAAGCSLNLHDGNLTEVKNLLHEIANKIKMKIEEEVHGRGISILVDIVTKNNRSIFGVSIQYRINGELKVRSIGMIELLKSHTAVYLADLIIQRLKVYGINLKQIITITTDNGANVLKMVRDIDAILQHAINAEVPTNQPDSPHKSNLPHVEDVATDDAITVLLAETDELTDDDAIEMLYEDVISKSNENLLSLMCKEMESKFGLDVLYDITGVNCAAHTLQLAIKSALEKLPKKYSNVISLSRRVAKILRKHTVRNEMKGMGKTYKKPRLDVVTRWGSTYMMVR